MQTRSSRKRKLEEEKGEPNKQRKVAEDDPTHAEKFEYFLELPIELQTEIYQRCTFPVKIHFNEVCKEFRNITGGWLRDLVFPRFLAGESDIDLKPSVLTRFTSLKRLCYNNFSFTQELSAYAKYLTSLEELKLAVHTPEQILYPARFLTNLRKLTIPDCVWDSYDFFGRLMRLTGLHSLSISCGSFLIEHITVFRQLTELKCRVQIWLEDEVQQPSFDQLTNLKKLQVTGESLMAVKMAELTQLEVLKLWDAELEENNAPLQNFKKLTQLEYGTSESKIFNLTFQMPQVQYLSLRYSASEECLKNFPNLITLKIRGNFALPPGQLKKLSLGSIKKFTTDILDALSNLTNLQSLSLHGSHLSKVLMDTNGNLPISLKELSIEDSSTPFSPNILPYLTRLSNLEQLTLIDTVPFSIRHFLELMPQLKVVLFTGADSSLILRSQNERSLNDSTCGKIYTDVIVE